MGGLTLHTGIDLPGMRRTPCTALVEPPRRAPAASQAALAISSILTDLINDNKAETVGWRGLRRFWQPCHGQAQRALRNSNAGEATVCHNAEVQISASPVARHHPVISTKGAEPADPIKRRHAHRIRDAAIAP